VGFEDCRLGQVIKGSSVLRKPASGLAPSIGWTCLTQNPSR
jgi:hypothetical protein